MLVGERMSHPVITIPPDMPVAGALDLMRRNNIRRAPVVDDGNVLGIVADTDLITVSSTPAHHRGADKKINKAAKTSVQDVMSYSMLAVEENTPIEEAARIMADNKIGGLPVMRKNQVVGIITETDLFKILLELMGAREMGVRVTALVYEERGQLAKLTQAITNQGGNFIAFGQFKGDDPTNRLLTFKVDGLPESSVKEVVEPLVKEIIDLRTSTGV